ncbi:MAG: glutaminyl-peptide cyclotransferase [Bacteroidia bacterium]
MKHFFLFSFLAVAMLSCKQSSDETVVKQPLPKEENTIPFLKYTLVTTLPHDTGAYTEGFFVHHGDLYESTGSPEYIPHTRSVIGIVDRRTGRISIKAELDRNKYFGEGIVLFKDKIYQLTYLNQTGFIYDAATFKKTGEFHYSNKEGWGLTTDGTSIIMSDGTNVLTYLDPATLKPLKTITVNTFDVDAPDYLNELEYINGFIYANIWKTNYIAKIDPATGNIKAMLDLSELESKANALYENTETMNGIAYDADADKIYVTGKMWPLTFQIDFEH